jgi:hypothetical protein
MGNSYGLMEFKLDQLALPMCKLKKQRMKCSPKGDYYGNKFLDQTMEMESKHKSCLVDVNANIFARLGISWKLSLKMRKGGS